MKKCWESPCDVGSKVKKTFTTKGKLERPESLGALCPDGKEEKNPT